MKNLWEDKISSKRICGNPKSTLRARFKINRKNTNFWRTDVAMMKSLLCTPISSGSVASQTRTLT